MLSIDRYITIKNQGYFYSESLEGLSFKRKLEFVKKTKLLYPNKEEFKLFVTTFLYPHDKQLGMIFKTNNKIFAIAEQLSMPTEIVTSKKIELKAYNTLSLINNDIINAPTNNYSSEQNIDLLLENLFGEQPQIRNERFEAIAMSEAIKGLLK